jgi:hypothetical protein
MSYNAVLTDKKGEQVLPITTAENVFYSGSKTVKQVIDDIIRGGGGGGGSSIIFGTVEPTDEVADCYVKYTDSSAPSNLISELHGSTSYPTGNVAEYDSENDVFILHANSNSRYYNYSMASIAMNFDYIDSVQIQGNCISYDTQSTEVWCMALGVGDYNNIEAHDTTDYELGVKACEYVFPNELPVGESFDFNVDVSDVSGTHYFNIIVQRSVEINLTLLTKNGEMPQELSIDDIYFRINDTWVKYDTGGASEEQVEYITYTGDGDRTRSFEVGTFKAIRFTTYNHSTSHVSTNFISNMDRKYYSTWIDGGSIRNAVGDIVHIGDTIRLSGADVGQEYNQSDVNYMIQIFR